jgi:hypothetical protein
VNPSKSQAYTHSEAKPKVCNVMYWQRHDCSTSEWQ